MPAIFMNCRRGKERVFMNELKFHGDYIKGGAGTIDLDLAEMVCVPSKPHYAEVDLCLRSGDDGKSGMNMVIGEVVGNWLSFDEKKKLGYEIERRWNAALKNKEESQSQLTTAAAVNGESAGE
jgi:hypothetical protein